MPLIDFEAEDLVDIPVANTGLRYAEPRATTKDNYNPFADNYGSEGGNSVKDPKDEWSAIPIISDEFDLASSMEFGLGAGASDTEFEYFEASEAEVQSLDLGLESREEPSSIALC
jgi:hypothetical protein